MGQSQSTSRCAPDCGTHNETLDLLAVRLREVERRFVEYMKKNTHIGTVWNSEPSSDTELEFSMQSLPQQYKK